MKYLLPAILLLIFIPACKKESIGLSYLKVTLNGQTYPQPGLYPNWNNWQNGVSVGGFGGDSMRAISSAWGFTDSMYYGNQVNVTLYPRLAFDIRGMDGLSTTGLTTDEKYFNLIKPGTLSFCSTASYTRCASIRLLDNNGNTQWSTDWGDNSSSTFTITGNGAHSTASNGMSQTIYAASFSCKLYDGTGNSQTFMGNCNCIVNY